MTGDTITLDEVVASAKMALQIRTTDSDIFLMDMANEGVRHVDSLSVFKKQICKIDIDTQAQTAPVPCGYKRLLGLRFNVNTTTVDGQETTLGNSCEDLIYVDLPYLKDCGCNTTNSAADFRGVFEIQHNTIFFHFLPENVTSVTMGYMGLNLDDKGRGIVYDDYRRALRAYICWKYCLSNSDEALYRNQVESHMLEWIAQKKWIKSNDQREKFHNEKHQIRSLMNSWLADKKNWATL